MVMGNHNVHHTLLTYTILVIRYNIVFTVKLAGLPHQETPIFQFCYHKSYETWHTKGITLV